LPYKLHTPKNFYEISEDGQDLRPKEVGAIINKHSAQQAGIKYYICNTAAQKMYNIKVDLIHT
jgi:predicted peroxiredoxin